MEELVEEDPNKTLSNETSIFAHADNCKALLQQVPQTFYFGTTIVGLTCMDVSDEYFAFGSDCGALFIFNRRINRPVTPLRTNYDEVVTCVRLFSGENSMMATGHKSGSIVLIRFPSGQPASRRKMEQTKLSECHKGHRINCVEWTNDASKLFSADESGMIVVTQIDFDNHLFQPSFVCNEGFSVSCISYAFSRLAVRSTHRVTVVNVASASTALDISASIDEPTNDHCGILLCDQFTNPTLFISSQSGVLYNFNALTGELRARNNLQQEINDKVDCACFLGSNEEDSKSTDEEEEVLMRLYALGDSRVLFFFKRHAVVVSVAEENMRLMDVRCLREMQMLHNSELREISVDRWSQPVALFVLTGDKRAIRFSSVAAPDYLTVASEPVEEFGARTLISSLQKTTKLLPYAPTGAILNRLKANGEIHGLPTLPSLPIPLFSNIMRSSGDLSRKNSQISLDGDSSGTETHRGDTALTADGLREGCGSDRYEAAEGDFTVGQAYTALKTVSDGKVVHNEAVKRGGSSEEQQVVLDWGRPQPNRLLDSVNEMAKRVVGVVGGVGAPAENGYFAMQTSPVSVAPSVASDSLPYEQFGMLEEVTVRRTKKAPGRKKKSASDEDNATRRFDSLPSYTEDFSSIDEETLSDILKALLGAPQSSVNRASADELEEEENNVNAHVPDVNREPTPQASISSSAEGAVPSQRASDSEDLEERETPELNKADAEKEAPGKEAPVRDANEQECNAYMQLMKRALMNKSAHFAGSQQSLEVFDEETFVEKIIVNDRGDIWNEMELPYSCVSFSVSSQYIVICHAKKKKKPRYMSIPSVSEGQWVPIKQDAEVIETNDGGTLLWRIHKGVVYSPVLEEASCSNPCASNWVIVANEGGGVVECALTRDAAWYITKSGEVYVQLRLPEMGILSRCESAWPLECITASEVAVWALQAETGRLVVRAGLVHCPIGLDWVEIEPEGPTRLISICLYGQSGWAIDEGRSLWFTNGVDFRSPFGTSGAWLQVCRPWDLSVDSSRLHTLRCSVRVSSLGVFVCMSRKIYWACSSSPLTGHRFRRIVPEKLAINDSFEALSAGSVRAKNVEALSLYRNNEVFLFRLRNRNFYSLPTFPSCYGCTLVQLVSFDTSVYVLDSSGCIYVRRNLGDIAPFGSEWTALNTGSCGAPIVSFAVTAISIWVLTAEAKILMLSRSGNTEPCVDEKAEWLKVRPPTGEVSFDQIRASCSGIYVWLFSRVSGRSWARSAVSDQCPCGKSWTEACEEPGVHELAVGCRAVWSLSSSGQLYRLRGLAAGNPAGNYWKVVPIRLKAIALDNKEHLWGIDSEGRLVSHAVEIYPPTVDRQLSVDVISPSSLESIDDFVSY